MEKQGWILVAGMILLLLASGQTLANATVDVVGDVWNLQVSGTAAIEWLGPDEWPDTWQNASISFGEVSNDSSKDSAEDLAGVFEATYAYAMVDGAAAGGITASGAWIIGAAGDGESSQAGPQWICFTGGAGQNRAFNVTKPGSLSITAEYSLSLDISTDLSGESARGCTGAFLYLYDENLQIVDMNIVSIGYAFTDGDSLSDSVSDTLSINFDNLQCGLYDVGIGALVNGECSSPAATIPDSSALALGMIGTCLVIWLHRRRIL